MRVPYWLSFLSSRRRAGPTRPAADPRRARPFRPTFEALEDRFVPSFSPITAYATGTNPQATVSAEFNNDGRLDLALADGDGRYPCVLLGNGDGTFQPARFVNTTGSAHALAVADFNRDGKADLAALVQDGVFVALGNGDGTFQAARYTNIGMTPTSVVVGDLNADGKLDMLTTSYFSWGGVDPYTGYSYGGSAGHANVLLGNGDATFVLRDSYSLDYPTSGSSSALGDFNADGKLDLAADGSVFLGNGDGTLRERQSGPMWAVAAAADLNADGRLDLVGDGVALGNADGTFQPARQYEAAGPSVRVADFDADGRPDLAAETAGSFLVVQLGNGDGTFRDAYHFAAGSGPSLTVGDTNDDHRPDVVTAERSAGTVTVLINDGAWAAPPDPTLTIGDVTVAEGNTGATAATFTVTLSAASARDVTVRYATADGYPWSPATAGSD